MLKKVTVLLLVMMLMSGCSMTGKKAQTPDFYPNHKYLASPVGERDADLNGCLSLADEYIKEPNKYGDMAKEGFVGAVIGAGTGAVGGAIMGNAGRATGAGAAIGGILGVLHSLSKMNEHSPSYQRFVEHCLQKKGYEVIGWSTKGSMW